MANTGLSRGNRDRRRHPAVVGQSGRSRHHGFVDHWFRKPGPAGREDNKHFSLGFNCGGGTTAMALWECVRSYMEVGPQAVPESRVGIAPYEETQIGSIITDLRKGNLLGVFWGVFHHDFGHLLGGETSELETFLSARPALSRHHRMVKTPATRAMGQTLPGTGSRHRRTRSRTGRAGGAELA
jgi:hypothetical protein